MATFNPVREAEVLNGKAFTARELRRAREARDIGYANPYDLLAYVKRG